VDRSVCKQDPGRQIAGFAASEVPGDRYARISPRGVAERKARWEDW